MVVKLIGVQTDKWLLIKIAVGYYLWILQTVFMQVQKNEQTIFLYKN